MPKIRKPKYSADVKDYLGTKASDRRRIPAPGKGASTDWRRWWMADENDIAEACETIILKIEQEQSLRFTSFINWARLYGNWEATSWGSNVLNNTNQDLQNESPLRLNLIQSGIDACAAKIAKDDPQPYVITTGTNNYFDKRKAEKFTRFIRGILQTCQVSEKTTSQFRDAEVYGTGAIHFYYDDDNKPHFDWVPTFELRVADMDGLSEYEPRSMHRVRMMPREKLIAMFPKKEAEINEIQTDAANRLRETNKIVDMVKVKESWHLKSSEKAKDGLYCFTVNDLCLKKESYDLPFFPIIAFRWMDKMLGFYGRSVVEEVYSLQMSLDELLDVAAQSYQLVGMPYWALPFGAQVPEDQVVSNFIARVINYAGTQPPTIITPEPLPPSFFEWINWHQTQIYAIIGISQAQATSENQLGPNASGEAIRQVVDIETTRFSQVSKRWVLNFKHIAEVIIAVTSAQAKKSDKDVVVQYTNKWKQTKEYKFKDVNLDDFIVGCDVISNEPNSVAGRVQTTDDYVQRNWITPLRAMEINTLDPDIQEEVRRKISSLNLTEQLISEMVEDNTPHLPEPYMIDLKSCQQLSQELYNLLKADGCPEPQLQLVRNWIDACVKLQTDPQYLALNPPPAPAPPGQPQPLPPNVPMNSQNLPPQGVPLPPPGQ